MTINYPYSERIRLSFVQPLDLPLRPLRLWPELLRPLGPLLLARSFVLNEIANNFVLVILVGGF